MRPGSWLTSYEIVSTRHASEVSTHLYGMRGVRPDSMTYQLAGELRSFGLLEARHGTDCRSDQQHKGPAKVLESCMCKSYKTGQLIISSVYSGSLRYGLKRNTTGVRHMFPISRRWLLYIPLISIPYLQHSYTSRDIMNPELVLVSGRDSSSALYSPALSFLLHLCACSGIACS